MNKYQKEMLINAVHIEDDKLREKIFEMIYILPQRKKHDSGYKMMYVLGTATDKKTYLIATFSDVVEFENILKNKNFIDIHIDILYDGIIQFWCRRNNFKVEFNLSTCEFSLIERER